MLLIKKFLIENIFLFVKYLLAVLPYILTFTIYLLAFSFIRNEHLVFFV